MFNRVPKGSGFLFSSEEVGRVIECRLQSVCEEADEMPAEIFLNSALIDLIQNLVKNNILNVPKLRVDDWSFVEREVKVDISQDRNHAEHGVRHPWYVSGQKIEIEIPFDGDADLFYVRPGGFNHKPPEARVVGNSIVLDFCIPGGSHDVNVKAMARGVVDDINLFILGLNRDFKDFEDRLTGAAEHAVLRRRTRLKDNLDRVAGLGFSSNKK